MNMRLMPKGFKNNHDNAPLSAARGRVRDSWKLLKQSLYNFSSSKSKSDHGGEGKDVKLAAAGGGLENISYNSLLKDQQSVEAIVARKVSSFLNDAEDYDGIAELLDKYKHELQAFNRVKNNTAEEVVSCSDFSEISSISELSLSDQDDEPCACSTLNRTEGQTRINNYLPNGPRPRDGCSSSSLNPDLNSSNGYLSSTLSPASTSSHIQSSSLKSSTITSDYSLHKHHSPSSLGSTVWTKITPTHSKETAPSPYASHVPTRRRRTSQESRGPPPERATAVFKPLPSLMKPCFIPDVTNFDRKSDVRCRRRSDNKDDVQQYVKPPCKNNTLPIEQYAKPSSKNNSLPNEQCFDTLNNKEINTKIQTNDDSVFSDYVEEKINSNSKHSNSNSDSHGNGVDERFHHTLPSYNNTESHSEFMSRICSSSTKHSSDSFSTTLENHTNYTNGNPKENSRIFLNSQNYSNSLPNMALKNRTSSEGMLRGRVSAESRKNSGISNSGMSSFDSENFLSKSSLVHSFDTTVEADIDKLTMPAPKYDVMFNNEQTNGENVSADGSLTMVDENYFIVYPDANAKHIACGNPPCSKIQETNERTKFTSCPSCYICYCSRTCRHSHWPIHMDTCLVGFVNFYVHTFFRRCEKDGNVNAYLKNLAYEAYQIFGRGCLVIPFESPDDVELDAVSNNAILSTQPMYKDFKRIVSENQSNRHLSMLCQNVKDYDPDQEFVLNIFVWIDKPSTSTKICKAVVRSARIAMLTSEAIGYSGAMSSYGIRKFSIPASFLNENEDIETRRFYCKEIAFGLKRYGVHLKSNYPEAYEKLYRYIDDQVVFSPIVLYGKRNDRNFKCILYPGNAAGQSQDNYGDGVFV